MRVVDVLDDFSRVTDMHLYFLCETEKGAFHEVFEEGEVLEYFFVGLFEELYFEAFGQFFDKEVLLFVVELFSDVGRFFDVIVDAPLEVLRDVIFACEFAEDFEVFAFLNILGSDIADEGTDAVDVVGETNAGDHFDESQDYGLLVGGGS